MSSQKDIHIVFGYSNAVLFKTSEIVDRNSILFIYFQDDLTIGPICDLDSVEGIEKRKEWFLNVMEIEECRIPADDDIKKIKTLIENYKNEKIYLWTGLTTYEILHTARLLYHLSVPCNNIFLIDFSKIPPKKDGNEMYYLNTLSVMNYSEIKKLSFNQLTEEKLSYFVQQWEKVKSGNSILRILDENKQVLEVEETYYDSLLISCCIDEYRESARVIGDVLGRFINNYNYICDEYLNYRLKQLALTKKIEYRGKLGAMRNYEVKLIN